MKWLRRGPEGKIYKIPFFFLKQVCNHEDRLLEAFHPSIFMYVRNKSIRDKPITIKISITKI